MDEQTELRAKAILVKPTRAWSKEENKFIYAQIKAAPNNRDILKSLRNEALLDE